MCLSKKRIRRRLGFPILKSLKVGLLCALLSLQVFAVSIPSSNSHIDFTQPNEGKNWIVVNDTVMGGRSASQVKINQNMLVFSGALSLQNNGGFASIRRIGDPKVWAGGQNIALKVTGDGREYQFRLRTQRSWDGVAYVATFKTTQESQFIVFNERDFTPQWRGRRVTNAPKLNFGDVKQIGFMLADKQPGNFELKVETISQQFL